MRLVIVGLPRENPRVAERRVKQAARSGKYDLRERLAKCLEINPKKPRHPDRRAPHRARRYRERLQPSSFRSRVQSDLGFFSGISGPDWRTKIFWIGNFRRFLRGGCRLSWFLRIFLTISARARFLISSLHQPGGFLQSFFAPSRFFLPFLKCFTCHKISFFN